MRKMIALAVAGISSGCGTQLPELATKSQLPMHVLVAKIDCEFQEAVWYQIYERGRTGLKTWQAAYTLTLKGNEIGSVRALTNTFPFTLSKLNSMNLGVGGGVTATANRTAILGFSLNFSDIKQQPVCAYAATGHPFLTGSIGLHDWLDDALSGFDKSAKKVTRIGHTFQFIVDASGSISPGFVIGPAPTIGLNPSGSQERIEDNSVDVALSRAVPVTETVAQVIARTSADQIAEMEKIRQEIEKLLKKKEEADKHIMGKSKETQTAEDAELQRQLGRLNFLQKQLDVMMKTVNRRAGVYYTADQNPNILATQQQLTLERLNNALRINIP